MAQPALLRRRQQPAGRSVPARSARLALRLTPLASALAMAWNSAVWAAPAPATVPIPAATWRVSGAGRAAPVNTPNPAGGINQVINQTSSKAIYNWQSFDIGAASQVTFDMALKGASALNRVTGSATPSQIFGQLRATNGGEIVLVNRNGVLFGRGATVATGGLIASALSISDTEYLSGFTNSLSKVTDNGVAIPAFRYDGAAADFVDSRNFVRVDAGAHISTDSGGRVFLFAKRVDNAGSIEAPSGQVVLGGGGSVFFKLPDADGTLYASETNPNVSALRGFLVEVGSGPQGAPEGVSGSVGNASTGVISTPRGNTTLVGLAVNQMGRISATTSVSENGSVILRAQGAATFEAGTSQVIQARESGALVLGAGSSIQISPEASTATSTDSAGFATSHVDLSGHTVVFERSASVVAPGATVNLRAESVPSYRVRTDTGEAITAVDPSARIVLGENAVIDVSGTTSTQRSVADLFVTTELLGSNDLKDSPLQKDGLLYRGKVTVDTRSDSLILGSLDSYRSALGRTVAERLSAGGTVNLRAEGAVLTHASSNIRVTGGEVRYTAAQVSPTLLLASNGSLYDLNNAPADLVYSGALNFQKSADIDYSRWGQTLTYGTRTSRTEAGYTEGRQAGSVAIAAPVVLLKGALSAGATTGQRQAAGLSPLASTGTLTLGLPVNGQNFLNTDGANPNPNALLGQFTISQAGPAVEAAVWNNPLTAALPETSGLSAAHLGQAGFKNVTVVANGDVRFEKVSDQPFELTRGGSLHLWSARGDVALDQSLRGAAATVDLISRDKVTQPDIKTSGSVQVADGVTVDLSGEWVNQWLGGQPLSTAYTGGGSFNAGGFGVRLGTGSVVDVSGGGSVTLRGVATGAGAGSIALADYTLSTEATQPTLALDGELRGFSGRASSGLASGGGSLSLKTTRVRLSDDPAEALADGLTLGSAFFSQGGFGSFSIDGRISMEVAAGTVIAPVQQVWQPVLDSRDAPTGSATSDALGTGLAPGLLRPGINLSLASSGDSVSPVDSGVLRVGEGAQLRMGPQASISLGAVNLLEMNGLIESHGGKVALALNTASSAGDAAPALWLGSHSVIDVSGTTLYTPDRTDGVLDGRVLAGGTIDILSGGRLDGQSTLVIRPGALLDASGTVGLIDLTERSATGVHTVRQGVASQGGSISLAVNGDAWLDGTLRLQGGDGAAGGSLTVRQLPGQQITNDAAPYDPRELQLAAAQAEDTGPQTLADLLPGRLTTGRMRLAADWLQASGATDLTLATSGTLRLLDDLSLDMDRRLTLVTQALITDPGVQASLSATNVVLGWNPLEGQAQARSNQTYSASSGDGSLTVNGRASLTMFGNLATQGVQTLNLSSGGDLQLQTGALNTLAETTTFTARQVYTATDSLYTVNAAGQSVRFAGVAPAPGEAASPDIPLSANGRLVVNAREIVQGGVLRAPGGHIELHASEQLTLAAGSETSVALAATVLYGNLNSSTGTWYRPSPTGTGASGTVADAPPDKEILLDGASVTTEAGSVLDVSGGGELLATEFVAGKGGSTNILAGGNGAYALLPSVKGLAPVYTSEKDSTAAAVGRQIIIRQAITLGDGSTLPAGTYTLLPARYAVLDGAFLVRPVSGTQRLSDGATLARTDGSVTLGARLTDLGTTGLDDVLTSNWQLMSKGIALKSSEIRETTASQFYTAKADKAGLANPQLMRDGGSVVISASQADLQGQGRFDGARYVAGYLPNGDPIYKHYLTGALAVVADQIQVDAGVVAPQGDGVLHLSAAQLNQLGGGTVILGGRAGAASETGTSLDVQARSVVFAQTDAEHPLTLTVADLLAVATETVQVQAGVAFNPLARDSAAASVSYSIDGNGAALRVASAADAQVVRTGTSASTATLDVGQGVAFRTGRGSLLLDSSGSSAIATSATLQAANALLSGGQMLIGAESGAPGRLVLTPEQLASLGSADQLTLRAYERMSFASGSTLGSAALKALVLDTPILDVNQASSPASVVAGDLTLTNTTGRAPGVNAGGEHLLSLQASAADGGTGLLHLAAGQVAVAGADQVRLNADTAVVMAGIGKFVASHDIQLTAPTLTAAAAAAEHTLQTTGTVLMQAGGSGVARAGQDGAVLNVQASAIDLRGRIELPSGQVHLNADGDLRLGAQAVIDTAGRQVSLGPVVVDQAGGDVALTSATASVTLAAGSRVDVSGAGDSGRGGSLALNAPQGQVMVLGELAGQTGESAQGARLSIDSGSNLRVVALSDTLAGGQFVGQISLRQRSGDLLLTPAVSLAAADLALQADAGAITVNGTLDARGAQGGSIRLSARDDLTVGTGAQLLAASSGAGQNGGRVELETAQGTLRMAGTSRIDVSAGAATEFTTPDGGRVTLRAARNGNEVAVGQLNGAIEGASRIDVQAVTVWDGITSIADGGAGAGVLDTATLASSSLAFIGANGQNAEQIALRLLGGRTDLSDVLKIHAEHDVRSAGDMTVEANFDWALSTESLTVANNGGNASHVGDSSLTLRAAGNLNLLRGIASGQSGGRSISNDGGDVRLVAGADLSAAHAETITAGSLKTLLLQPAKANGNFGESFTGSSTGDVALVASGDVDLAKNYTNVVSAGRVPSGAVSSNYPYAFGTGGGDIRLTAGRHVLSGDVTPFIGWDQGITALLEAQHLQGYGDLWGLASTPYSAPAIGIGMRMVGSFAGGAIAVNAGGDVRNLIALAPGSGYRLFGPDGQSTLEERHFAGGDVSVRAGRDIVSGGYQSGGAHMDLSAARDIRSSPGQATDTTATRLYYENTQVAVDARRDVALSTNTLTHSQYAGGIVQGLDNQASLAVTATGRNLQLNQPVPSEFLYTTNFVPSDAVFQAPSGSILSPGQYEMFQVSAENSRLVFAARDDVQLPNTLNISASRTAVPGTQFFEFGTAAYAAAIAPSLTDGASLIDQSNRSAVQVVALTGDATIDGVNSARPMQVRAGRDVSLLRTVDTQHQADAATGAENEQTLLQAGRDILFTGRLRVGGPGEVMLLAGRDIDLGAFAAAPATGSGVMAVGNSDNGLLGARASAVTLVAGLQADGADYQQAVKQGFAVIGSAALAARSADVYALLSAAPGDPVTLDSSAASAFKALGTAGQLAAVKTLMGSTAYNQALASYVRNLSGNAALTDAQALAAFAQLTPARQDAAPGQLLAGLLPQVDNARRHSFVAQVAGTDTPRFAEGLRQWMALRTGQSYTLDQALAAFEALPVERQLSWLNQVLVEEVRTAGRAATTLSGAEKDAAYLRGYLAIDALFPGERGSGDIRLPSTQIKLTQDAGSTLVAAEGSGRALQLGGITLLTPGGFVNAGETGATAQNPNNLGIITVAGGDISAISRGDFLVNQSRVFSLAEGDILLWSSQGDIDAGRGAKTVTGTPAPVLRLDPNSGKLFLDTSGSFSGSGIAVLAEGSDLDLYAPTGAIDAGEAGIRAAGNVFLGAVTVRGADNIQIGGTTSGANLSAAPAVLPSALAPVASDTAKNADDEEERRKKRRARRNLLLEFLGFGRA